MPSVATGRTGSRRADPERPQSSQHRQGVAFIIGVFKSADDGCSRADELGKLSLGYARRCAQLVDFAGDLFICPSLVQLRLGLPSVIAAVQNVQTITGWFRTLCHINPPHIVCLDGSDSNRFLRSNACSISLGGTARSFTTPCETTTANVPWKKYRIRWCTPRRLARSSYRPSRRKSASGRRRACD